MKVLSLSCDNKHGFYKKPLTQLTLITGLGVEGDAHCGETVKHRSRVKADPTQPNLRQVHLIHSELLTELQAKGFNVEAGSLGENILTQGVDLLSLPKDTLLHLGDEVVLQVTGLRNPCAQLDHYQKGLTQAVLNKDEEGNLIRKAGIMAIVVKGGTLLIEDDIKIELPEKPYQKLERV
ncbi:MAG: MOSC domain-containing protein [Marinomonas sp.]